MDTFALSIGSKITASSLVLACVLCVVLGATSLLSSLEEMDRDLKVMSKLLEDANSGLAVLNTTMDSLAPTTKSLDAIVVTVSKTSEQAKTSKAAISELGTTTTTLNEMLTGIEEETAAMSASEQELASSTEQLNATLTDLSTTVDPLATTQSGMLGEVKTMKTGIAGMNGSLAYTIRSLNYMTAPPTGQSFSLQVELDKKALPPIPGVKAKADPVVVFPRGSWPVYTGK
jgi:septal ring factor EnvC (AmiA/AmiB activator)